MGYSRVMRILIAGGAGYVGGYTTDYLTRLGHEVRVYDNLLYEEMYLKDTNFIFGDILDFNKLNSELKWAEVVIWLAALVGDSACSINESNTYNVNTNSIQNLVNNFDGIILFPSTCSVYGAQDELLDEKSNLMPLSTYAKSKIKAENILLDLAKDRTIIFRLGTLYGISDTYSRMRSDLVVNTLSFKAVAENKITVFGGNQFRPLLHVRDVAVACSKALKTFKPGIYNLHEDNFTIIQIAELVKQVLPEIEIQISSTQFQDSRNYRVDGSKVRHEISFAPENDVRSGIKQLVDLAKSGRVVDPFNERFINGTHLRNTSKA
jgi:nucleoside-diphosphate-sugar epimerase